MLESLLKQTGSWVVKAFLGLLILSFAVWGIGDIFRGPSDATVAVVGDVEITRTEYGDAYRRELDRLTQRTGQQIDAEQARLLGVQNFTLQRMINRALLDQVAVGYGLTVTDNDLAADIRTNPTFQNNFGRFDPLHYRDVLRQLGYSREYFEFVRRSDLRRNQLMTSIALGAGAPKPVVDAIYRYRAERRIADFAVVLNSSMPEPGAPDSGVLEQFYQDGTHRYMAPEFRSLTYITLSPELLLDEVTVSDNEIQDEYESRLDEFIEPEQRDLSQLVLADETAARDALQQLRQGSSFDDVARDAAGLEPDDTALGLLRIGDLPVSKTAADAVFTVAEGEFSDPIQSDFGWHVYRVNKVVAGTTTSFADAKQQLQRELALRRASDSLFELANRLEDELAGGASLEEGANRLNLDAGRADRVDATGTGPEGTRLIDLPTFPEFLQTAFETQEGQESSLTESTGGGYFIVRVDEITPTAAKPLSSIRDEVIADWKRSEQNRLSRERAAALAERLRQGEDFNALAAKEGLAIRSTPALNRYDARTSPDVSGELLAKIFVSKNVGDVAEGPTAQGNGHTIAVLRRIDKIAGDAGNPTERQELRDNLNQALTDDIMAQYRVALSNEYDVEVNQNAIDSLF